MKPQVMELWCARCGSPVHIERMEMFKEKLHAVVNADGMLWTDDDVRACPSSDASRGGLRVHLFCEGTHCVGRSVLSIADHKGQFLLKCGIDPGEVLTSNTLSEAVLKERMK